MYSSLIGVDYYYR